MLNLVSLLFAIGGTILVSISYFGKAKDFQDEYIHLNFMHVGGTREEMLSGSGYRKYYNLIKLQRWGNIFLGISLILQLIEV